MAQDRALAVFDFDGTLTQRDTLVPFLVMVCGRRQVSMAMFRHSVLVARAAGGLGGEAKAKEALFGRLLKGRPIADIERLIPGFTDHLLAHGMRPEMVARAAWHREQGHHLVVVSASPALYVEPIAKRLGFETVIATRLEADGSGCLTGRLLGANVKGLEKVRRLHEEIGNLPVGWAYGNSRGDRELLALAREPLMVGKRARP